MRGKLAAFWRLSRAEHGVMTAIAVLAGAVSAGGVPWWRVLLGVSSAFLIEVFLFVTNDILNLEEDRVNSPWRPLVRGEVSVKEAWAFALASLVLGVLLTAPLGVWALAIIFLAAALGFLYNWRLKRMGLIGNAVVAFLTALAFFYGGIGVSGVISDKIILFTAIAFTANVGRELAKGVIDVEGDAAAGVATVAVIFGRRAAAALAAVFMLAAVAMSPLGLFYVNNKALYGVLIGVTDMLFVYSAVLLAARPRVGEARRVRTATLVGMALAIIAFMA